MAFSIQFKFIKDLFLIICVFLGLSLEAQEIIFKDGDSGIEDPICSSLNDPRGECMDIRKCLYLLTWVMNPDKHDYLRRANCGFNATIPMVCCDRSWNCTTPDNEPGHCIPFTSCPGLKSLVTGFTVSRETITYIKNRRCGVDNFNICCTSLSTKNDQVNVLATTAKVNPLGQCEMTSSPLDQLSPCCGRDINANRIIGGEATAIDQYPWTAAIEYVWENVVKVKCGGTLISGTYVVTAAHCLSDMGWIPKNVRLGDYDIDNPGVDCTEVDGGGEDCTDEVVIISIEKTILHPDYDPRSREQKNDIGLLQLQNAAPYTDFIRPICLPSTDFTKTPAEKLILKVAGWGASDEIRSYSPIKRHVDVPYVNQKDCFAMYRLLNISLGEGQICAGGEHGKDSCKGDSGGALMLIKEHVTEIAGIISFGYLPCGLEKKPAVYTKIHYYLPWIRSIIT